MKQVLAIPIEVRLFAVFVVGALAGRLINATVRWLLDAYPSLGGGENRPAAQSATNWAAHVPVLGPFWRPAAQGHVARLTSVELLAGLMFAFLYYWDVHQAALLPPLPPAAPITDAVWLSLHAQFFAHAILATAMLAASLIDLDEKIIPDAITIPGTLVGLLFAGLYPWALLPEDVVIGPAGAVQEITFLRASSPNPWPAELAGFPRMGSLLLGLGSYWLWCVALLPRRWRARHGWRRAIVILALRITREPFSLLVLLLGLAGSAGIASVWFFGGVRWEGLASALIGMAAAGGIVWVVRIIGSMVLQREAMGFGDVTLLAMIGTFVGWQASLAIFFIAPVFGLLLGVAQLVLRRDTEIPYGPFLCLATLTVVLRWHAIWEWLRPAFDIGWLVPGAVVLCMVLMALLLGIWRWVQGLLFGGGRAR